jgi:hypothetical protein
MPVVSSKQKRAMFAALSGHSNLGIPKSVAEKFVGPHHDAAPEGGDLSDFEAAEAVRDNELPSPTTYYGLDGKRAFDLFDLRITGTGAAWRESLGEWAHRDATLWTSPEFVQRCNGLQVIELHPPDSGLNSEEFNKRAIGSIVLPYVKGDEVWGIAKIFDADAAEAMQKTLRSTSPGVTAPKGSTPELVEGVADPVLNEGLPQILDHLAVCEAGVWDKGGPAAGVRLDAVLGAGTGMANDVVNSVIGKGEVVTDEEKAALEKERDDARKDAADAKAKLDEAEKEREDRRKKDAERRDKERRDGRRKHEATRRSDAGEKEESEEEEREREDRHKKDRAKRHDSAKHDGEMMDCAKCDAAEDEESEKEEKDRKDAAAAKVAEVNAEIASEMRDAKERADSMAEQIKALQANQQPMNHDDAMKIAQAFHRADSLFGMLGEKAPQHYPGEKPSRYQARLATELQKHLPDTSVYKAAVFNDSLPSQAFSLMEDALYKEVYAEAKSPTRNDSQMRNQLIMRETKDELGRTRREYTGSSRAGLGLFCAPSFVGKIVKPERV